MTSSRAGLTALVVGLAAVAAPNARSSLPFQRALMSYDTGVLGQANARIER
jgi:hypothetical protein